MGLFIISVIVCSIIGTFFSMMICGNLEGKVKPFVNTIIGILVALAFGFFMTCLMWGETAHEEKIWNNGICSSCEGEYTFSGASHYRTSQKYYYSCEECGHTIEVNHLQK